MPIKIYLSPPHLGSNEERYVLQAFETNWIAPLGPNVNLFEDKIGDFYNNKLHCAVLSSGTAAIHLALKLLGVTHGDDVLCQSFTFAASANPITYLGANPIFIDSEEETWNISPELLEDAIEDGIKKGKKAKAIVAVDLYGMPFKVEEITAISQKYNIPLIEDSAEALGSHFKNTKCGSFGEIGILSFNGNKIITTSGGGALLAKDKNLVQKAIHLATQARDQAPHYQHSEIGHNYRMSNVLAGIGAGQMEVLEKRVHARRRNFEFYKDALKSISSISFVDEPEGYFSNRWLTCLLTDSFETREKIRTNLLNKGIESRPLWKPMHMQPVFSKNQKYVNGVSEDLFNRGLCLPSGSSLEEEQLVNIVNLIKKTI
ncbi:aminotransferase class I/II-fold pyridoxal phosphate-dependent enzyme [Croceivirga lutea]|uniref:aminotransferase class I/II-fold pyridoxal phosphate-dependent enzyme n=1 Tax=Croceivirga lutea TaxID=1775167 RepID=UPI00163A4DF3|nr:aminotransferase class I/II-fold pyridoxal phosphate-dependent enzyme [Croceivirga lutea]